jgi:hypothetical protein
MAARKNECFTELAAFPLKTSAEGTSRPSDFHSPLFA